MLVAMFSLSRFNQGRGIVLRPSHGSPMEGVVFMSYYHELQCWA